eukprot:TRINITY_DN2650_c1_g1_i2.p1 TRINITY_DN2650_c1_g1~~TRINITY_DN2650_c1_g1_i2.p1  ORF type:complete len:609 (+),score=102.37 TRINITY_DN2650_c1_g1_i2:81-1829(+)
MLTGMMIITTAWAASDSELRLVESSEKVQAQLQEWEGKTTGCWIEAVRTLRDGCNEAELLREEDRKRLAFMFASCQLQEDGIEPQKDPTEMAIRAKDGYPLVYQTYTEYLVNVEVICNTLSQRIFQKETRNAMASLKQASVAHLKELESLKTSMNNIKTMANIIRNELETQQVEMSGKFLLMLDEQDKMSDELEKHSASVDNQFAHLDAHIASGHNRLADLKDQTANVSVMLMSVETSATAIRENQEVFHYYWHKADDLLTILNSGVSSVATLVFITTTCILSYVLTSPIRTRSARFPLMITFIMCYLTESLVYFRYEHTPLQVLEKTWFVRKLYLVIGLGCLLDAALKYVEPETQFVRKLNEFEGRFFDRVKNDLRERARSLSREPGSSTVRRLDELEASLFERIKNELQQKVRSLSRASSRQPSARRAPSVVAEDRRSESLDVVPDEVIDSTPEIVEPSLPRGPSVGACSEKREPTPECVVKEEPVTAVLPVTWTPSSYSCNYSSYRQNRSPSYESMRGLSLSSETFQSARSTEAVRNYSVSPEVPARAAYPRRVATNQNPLSDIDIFPIDSSGRSVFDW